MTATPRLATAPEPRPALTRPPATRPPARRVATPLRAMRPPAQPPASTPVAPAGSDGLEVASETERVARAVTTALVEALAGRRAVGQVAAFADGGVLATVVDHARSRRAHGLLLRSVRVQAPLDHVAEVAFRFGDGRRSSAGALRLERRHGRWRCVALEVVLA